MGRQGLSSARSSPGVGAGLIVAASIVVLDQLTKVWVVASLDGDSVNLLGEFLQFRVTRNTGAAFSVFTGYGPLLGVLAVGIAVVVVAAIPRVERRLERVALAMVAGGAVGNLVDRIFRGEGILDGAVVDFIDFSFFPAFNVADSCITIGVILLLLSSVFPQQDELDGGANHAATAPAGAADAPQKGAANADG